ncbi:tmv resistance protein n [Nicotiana attenuata]|uniref:Tmv resistance protein n n=2 Tax=Nicotiana attenuata TaxID=49451 RepID=A0A314L9U0_NICAT|nr:tmv resistance protein n [Nicotiana attenuata]
MILPIFYDVDPSGVRRQTGLFGEGFAKHKERSFGAQRVEKWTTALTEAANLSGWDLRNVVDGHESKFIECIVQQVLQVVNQTPLDVAWYPTGVDSRVKDIELLLQCASEDKVRMVGIYGVGGIGKTTLAKAIYNRIFRPFNGSCFLSGVRSEAEEFGLVKLQQKLLQQILKTKDIEVGSVAEGVNLIKARLGSKKVLIVLDDVDHIRQLESLTRERSWFGSGSLIIVTTRDEHLLFGLRENERYKTKLLNDDEAMQLFSCHAFDSLHPPEEYVELVKAVIKYSGGLPLALVTLGSHFQGRSVEEGSYEFHKLRAIPRSDIQKILKLSFDGLDGDTQSVFLDIACAFHGFSMDEVSKTLNACGFFSGSAIATLVRKCLLQSIRPIEMHDLVRAMGREIVRLESTQYPEKRSRLFNPQEVHDVLQGHKGTFLFTEIQGSKKVEVLMVNSQAFKGVNLSTKAFRKMKNLRVLKINELHISGDFEQLSKELRWLSWQKCPLKYIPSHFPAQKLVVLDMQESKIQEFGLSLQCCKSLKKLDLSNCKRLKRTPNFNGPQSLETLRLGGCSRLKKIHESIGNLDRLIDLDLFRCEKLKDLPSSICQLKFLQNLEISGCSYIQTLPVDLGEMRSLRQLLAYDTGIKQLPGSVELLRHLEVLKVGGSNLEPKCSFSRSRVHHIQSFSTSITVLSLTYCGLSDADIPRDIGSLSSLQILNLSGNSFHCLPSGLSKLRLLFLLGLDDCENLQTLPSLSNLQKLKNFSIENCKKLVKITGLDNLPSINWINMLKCSSLQNPFNEGFFSAPGLAIQSRHHRNLGLDIYLETNEIPNWCRNQVTDSSICFTMPIHEEYKFLGMILWCACNFVNVSPYSRRQFLSFRIAGKISSFCWPYYDSLPTEHAELLRVSYVSYLDRPFDGQMKGGEKMEVFELGEKNIVKNIGIHLLYLDQQGKVTSLPAMMDHSDQRKRSREVNGVSDEKHPKRSFNNSYQLNP